MFGPEEVFSVVEVFVGAGISVETASVEEEHSRGQLGMIDSKRGSEYMVLTRNPYGKCDQTSYLSLISLILLVEKKLSCGEISAFHV